MSFAKREVKSNNIEAIMDSNSTLEELFGALKDVSAGKSVQVGKSSTFEHDENDNGILNIDNDKKDTEKVFAEIEQNLKKLPKLNTEFDSLANKKATVTLPSDNRMKPASESSDWFLLPKASDSKRKQLQRDLMLIKHRAALDPKRHYKKDKWQVPDRFAVGTIIEGKDEFYSSRISKKQRKSTIMESIMSDDVSSKYFKRKYSEIQVQKTSGRRAHFNKNKVMRKKY